MKLAGAMNPPGQQTLAARRTTFVFIRTLLWKNWVLKKRHIAATISEIVVPMLFIIILGLLKSIMTDVDVPAGWSDTTSSTGDDSIGTSYNLFQSTGGSNEWLKGVSLPKFVFHETSMTGLILGLGLQSISDAIRLEELSAADYATCTTGVLVGGLVDTNTSSDYRVPTECDDKVAPYKIAIIPDNTFTRNYFLQTMDAWYPRIDALNSSDSLQIPSFRESVQFFDSNDALNEYVKANDYGKGVTRPRIYGAIVFDTYPSNDEIGKAVSMEYTLRLNSTVGSSVGRVPSSSGSPNSVYPFQKEITTTYYSAYTLTGFNTLQTLITRFASCLPEWDSSTQTTTGDCQITLSTAQATDDVDERLMSSLENDGMIQYVLNAIAATATNSTVDSFSSLAAQMSSATKELLLTPLRQAPQAYLGATVAPFPVESYLDSPFYSSVKQVFALVFILSYLFIVSRILVAFIQEKESRMREFMKILGVQEKAIIISWYISYFVILFIGAVLQAIAGMVGLFSSSSPVVIFLFFFLFGLSVLGFAFLISTIFSKSRTGSFVGMVLFFVMYFVSVGFSDTSSESSKMIGCIFSPVALSFGINVIADAETTGEGIGFSNIGTVSDNFRVSTALLMFIVDTLVYTILGLYFEKVIPKEYGTTLKWYFPVSPSYWRGRRRGGKPILNVEGPLLHDVVLDVNPNFEAVGADLRNQESTGEALAVKHIRKVFSVPGGEKVAVKGVTLSMYKNQITCLLGHNGAGKTTLISMLTGMTAPTSGNATFNGLTLTDDMDEIRQSLGICFQHDVLFPELTVEEHLIIFGRIKGYRDAELQTIVDTQIREVGLTEKRHVKSGELSGGMKRKLSVAISLLGDSSLVFLDEPTSGMDPYSRRSTWEILLNNRNDRVMVLTTHFMDEADILGDRIAIMAEGEVRCAGSSLFLKNRFGAGYNLTVVKDDAKCVDSNVISFVSSFVPSAQVLSNVGSEIAFQLPIDSSSQFAGMFSRMDAEMGKMGLLSYGVSVTTLEEVFIKVAEMDDEGNQHTLTKAARTDGTPASSPVSGTGSDSLAQTPPFSLHLKALLLKRFRYARRDKKMLFYSTALPIFLLMAGLGMMKSSSISKDNPTMALSTADYTGDSTPTPFYCQADTGEWCSSIMDPTFFTGAALEELEIDDPAYSTSSPTVFNVTYTDPTINNTDATGYELAMGQELYNRGYGFDTTTVEGQFGAFLVYGDSENSLLGYNTFVNTTGSHASAVFKALMDQAIYRFFASNASSDPSSVPSLSVNSYPLPLTAASKAFFTSILAFASSELICIAFTFFPASIVVFLVKEKQATHNSKHQQLVSGVSLSAFWLSNYIWDLIMYIIPCIAAIGLIKGFNISTMTGASDCAGCTSATFPAVILLFILFGFAVCPFTYCLSYLFKEHASSQTYTVMINFVLGVVLMIVSFILDLVSDASSDVNSVLKFIWRLSPLFNLGNGLLKLVLNEFSSVLDSKEEKTSPFSTDLMGFELMYLALTAIGYFALAVGIDYAMTFPKFKDAMAHHDGGDTEQVEMDQDVIIEAERVARGDADNDFVKLKNLRKVYPGGKIAVRDLSFGLKRGECFGFLGINGAGKTTTMKMLTGDELPTYGQATLAGYDIMTQQIEVRRQIGYCPQFDALFDLLTVREHLELFGSIKGLSGTELEQVVSEKIEQMNLADFENKLAGSLSGGNKRKLSVAIAMIGSPRIIFLDEPSTGMDPVSRRFMWDVIAGISTRGKSSTIVLTTHSMEEAEALCSRVGIMVGGRMRCLGSVQHLKSRFGDGLVFDVKLNMPTAEELEYLVQEVFGGYEGVVTPVDLADKCEAFGNRHLADRVVASHPTGYSLAAAIERDGFIRAEAFCSWCIEETRFDALNGFLVGAFGEQGATVMERQNDFCRFKLRGSTGDLKLSKVFALIEDSKKTLEIREYSVSQTTLEQIFNGFASQQQEEKGAIRGVYKGDDRST